MSMFGKRNNAIEVNTHTVNGVTADIAITERGSDWYWAVTAVMTVSWMIILGMSMRVPRSNRIFHYMSGGLLLVASIAYFSMASNLGFTPVAVEFQRSDPKVAGQYREMFYVRYIDWFITTPLLLMDLLLTAGMPWPTVLWVVLVDEVMIVTGLVGALVRSSYKWGYFVFGCFAMFFVFYELAWTARRNAAHLGSDVSRVFNICGVLTLVVWLCYPIAWGVAEGGNIIAPDSEAIFYGILDILAKPVFAFMLIWGHRNIDPARLGMSIRDYGAADAVHNGAEKHTNGHSNGHSNGVTNGHSDGVTNGTTNGHTAV